MKKFISLLVITLLVFATASFAVDEYNASTYEQDLKYYIARYETLYYRLNRIIAINEKSSYTYDSIVNMYQNAEFYKAPILNGFVDIYGNEVRFVKLKQSCHKLPSNLKDVARLACGKVIVDTNGFNTLPNKLFRDVSTVMVKDQFILYLYANGVKPELNSPEDVILYQRMYKDN